jgi:hypothetical protein
MGIFAWAPDTRYIIRKRRKKCPKTHQAIVVCYWHSQNHNIGPTTIVHVKFFGFFFLPQALLYCHDDLKCWEDREIIFVKIRGL